MIDRVVFKITGVSSAVAIRTTIFFPSGSFSSRGAFSFFSKGDSGGLKIGSRSSTLILTSVNVTGQGGLKDIRQDSDAEHSAGTISTCDTKSGVKKQFTLRRLKQTKNLS